MTGHVIAGGKFVGHVRRHVNGDTTFEGDESFVVNLTNVTGARVADGQGTGTIANDDAVAIRDVQATTHVSPLNGQNVILVPSVVTALRTSGSTRGFYLQDPTPDADVATSEGIFVFTGSSSNPASLVSVGDLVRVGGSRSSVPPMPA